MEPNDEALLNEIGLMEAVQAIHSGITEKFPADGILFDAWHTNREEFWTNMDRLSRATAKKIAGSIRNLVAKRFTATYRNYWTGRSIFVTLTSFVAPWLSLNGHGWQYLIPFFPGTDFGHDWLRNTNHAIETKYSSCFRRLVSTYLG